MEPLQNFGHRNSAYERPNDAWVCGWACEGNACQRGPDARGRCQMLSECQPTKDGDRYQCALPAAAGGPCKEGPRPDGSCCRPQMPHPPCQPQRSLRSKRKRASWTVAVVTLALIAIALGGSNRAWFLTPGDLSAPHAAISHQGMSPGQSCAACHAVADDHGPQVLASLVAGGAALKQSQQCLACHFTGEGEAEHAMHAHGLPPEELQQQTNNRDADASASQSVALIVASLAPSPMEDAEQFACAQCHQEHRGRSFDLTHMSDARCQSCHAEQFESFSQGHPAFRPKPTEPAIHFDHVTHQDHFGSEQWSCVRCHGQTKQTTLKPFAQACASCHTNTSDDHHVEQIKRASLTVFEVPELDVEEDETVGEWPMEIATGMEMPLLMRLLVVSDATAIGPLSEVREEFWEPGMWFPEEPEDATHLAVAIKEAMRDLLLADRQALTRRFSVALAVDAEDPKLARLVQTLIDAPLLDELQQNEALQQFLQLTPREPADADLASASASSEADEADEAVGWILGNNGAVEYQDPQHANPFYHALLDLLAATAGTPAESADEAAQFRATVREEVWQTVLDGGPLSPFTLGCLKCHNITGNEIQWESRQVAFQHPASAFSNDDPHIVLNSHEALRQGQQCVICHTPTEADPETAGDELADRLDFKPLDRASCATCHNAVGARESCLTCHSYHHQ